MQGPVQRPVSIWISGGTANTNIVSSGFHVIIPLSLIRMHTAMYLFNNSDRSAGSPEMLIDTDQ